MNTKIAEIAQLFQTQDHNWHMTANPMYLVEKKVLDYGFDSEYCSDFKWIDKGGGEGLEVDDKELIAQLEAADDNFELEEKFPDYERVYYRERWEFVTMFFTEKNAREFIERNAHKYGGELRLYVDSAYRNLELQTIMEFLENYGK